MHPSIEQWLSEAAQVKSARTIDNARRSLAAFVTWYEQARGRDFDPEHVEAADVEAWREDLAAQYAPATVNLRLTGVNRFFIESQRRRLDVQREKIPAAGSKAAFDLDQLLAAAKKPRDSALILIFAQAGLRVSEVLVMRVGDLIGDELTVRGRHARRIKLAPEVREALRVYLEAHPAKDEPEAWMWVKSNGNRISSASGLYRLLNRRAGEVGLGKVSAEDLRWLFGQRYLAKHPNDIDGMHKYLNG